LAIIVICLFICVTIGQIVTQS